VPGDEADYAVNHWHSRDTDMPVPRLPSPCLYLENEARMRTAC
jgi:hypothetical protein